MNVGNATAPGDGPAPPDANTLLTLARALATQFFVISLGWSAKSLGFVPPESEKGVGALVGKICLPVLIMQQVAKLDLRSVEYNMVLVILITKLICVVLCLGLALFSTKHQTPGGCCAAFATASGMFIIFTTMSNDIAIGLGIIKSLYPISAYPEDISAYIFVAVGMQQAIFNPIGFTLLETGRQLKQSQLKTRTATHIGRRSSSCRRITLAVVRSLAQSPIVVGTLVGLIYNFANPPTPGDTSTQKNIPLLIDQILSMVASAFTMAALFMAGMAISGKFKYLSGQRLIMALILTLIKVIVAPLCAYFLTRLAFGTPDGECMTEQCVTFSNFAFIYGSIPAANAVIIFAQQYGVFNQHMISSAFLVCFMLFVPVVFLVASLLTDPTSSMVYKELNEYFQYACNLASALCCIFILVTFIISPGWRTLPKLLLVPFAIYSLLYNIFQFVCFSIIESGYPVGSILHMCFYHLANVFRQFHMSYLTLVIGVDMLVAQVWGPRVAYRLMWLLFALSALYATIHGSIYPLLKLPLDLDSPYPCWYMYKVQNDVDFILLVINVVIVSVVIGVILIRSRAQKWQRSQSMHSIGGTSGSINNIDRSVENTADFVGEDGIDAGDRGAVEDEGKNDADDDADDDADNDDDNDDDDERLLIECGDNDHYLDKQTGSWWRRRCKGWFDIRPVEIRYEAMSDWWPRVNIFCAIGLLGLIMQIITNRQDSSTETGGITATLRLLSIILVGLRGLFLLIVFASMKGSEWPKAYAQMKSFMRRILYSVSQKAQEQRVVAKRFRPDEQGHVHINFYEFCMTHRVDMDALRMCRKICEAPDVLTNERWRLRTYAKCATGRKLVDWVMNESAAVHNREEAVSLLVTLYDVGLLFHIAHEHEFDDDHYFYRFHHIVDSSQEEQFSNFVEL